MAAEQLIAFEAALAELGRLYTVAKGFTALRERADGELLPRLTALAARLRSLLRAAQLTDDAIDAVATQILALGSAWHIELEQVHASAVYRQTLAAMANDRQDELTMLIPRIFAGLEIVQPVPSLYFSVSPAAGRRTPGTSPFLSAAECAERIGRLLADGIVPANGGTEWWERELLPITCADTPSALDTPIALGLNAADVRVAVFAPADEPTFRIFTPRLRASMSITLAAEATDEWWEAYEDSYHSFRDALQKELAARGQAAVIVQT